MRFQVPSVKGCCRRRAYGCNVCHGGAPRLGRQHIRDGRIRFREAKNEHRNPINIDIPVHPALAESIGAANVSNNMTFLLTEFGKPFTANGFGNKFKDWCCQADPPHCSAHGVRKATATALAEAEATPYEIMAITGHQTLAEVERYTKAVRRRKTADAGMRKLIV
ncbi:tyrosine-type recombinase/integrase [Bradyrhizobium sp. CCBAU 51627]|uniref:tyrosine-type recombinase/integrase n=1 Tax=Bradyrhizobium sp. CCBAU 51627 TaxID=1325088 RepID=UPI002305EDA5|nr:tyrosine-type recombinase/integrase [Bradyrhizobium sp. CCBAU 51627]